MLAGVVAAELGAEIFIAWMCDWANPLHCAARARYLVPAYTIGVVGAAPFTAVVVYLNLERWLASRRQAAT